MSRYLILLILNLPFILAAIFSAFVNYKMGRLPRRKLFSQVIFWLIILAGLASAEPIYEWLFSHDLTQTEPLSLFDVVQITAIVIVIYGHSRLRSRVDALEERLKTFNTEVSIQLAVKRSASPVAGKGNLE